MDDKAATRRPVPPPRNKLPSFPRGDDDPVDVRVQEAEERARRAELATDRERARRLAAEQSVEETLEHFRTELEALKDFGRQRPKVESTPPSSVDRDKELGRAVRTILKQFAAVLVTAALGSVTTLVVSKKIDEPEAAKAAKLRELEEAKTKALEEEVDRLKRRDRERSKYDRDRLAYELELWNEAGANVPRPEGLAPAEDIGAKKPTKARGLQITVEKEPPIPP